jgi:hypothetical protein
MYYTFRCSYPDQSRQAKRMGGEGAAPGASYSPAMGLIYIFNLIVGTGALTLPAAFHDAGMLLFFCFVFLLWKNFFLEVIPVVVSVAN